MSYTPTEWKSGDIITEEKLNNIEQGIVNAGGGSGTGLIVNAVDNNHDAIVLDKTFSEIFNAFSTGVQVRIILPNPISPDIIHYSSVINCKKGPDTFYVATMDGSNSSSNHVREYDCSTENGYPKYDYN